MSHRRICSGLRLGRSERWPMGIEARTSLPGLPDATPSGGQTSLSEKHELHRSHEFARLKSVQIQAACQPRSLPAARQADVVGPGQSGVAIDFVIPCFLFPRP